MEDTFGKVVAILLCAIQMFVIPVYLYSENAKRLEQNYIMAEITYNVDNFRNTGMIDSDVYNSMRNRIFSLSNGYNVKIIHSSKENGESATYYNDTYYENHIEDELEQSGIYYLEKSDYINIWVEDKSGNIVYRYGGTVKNEAY